MITPYYNLPPEPWGPSGHGDLPTCGDALPHPRPRAEPAPDYQSRSVFDSALGAGRGRAVHGLLTRLDYLLSGDLYSDFRGETPQQRTERERRNEGRPWLL